MLRTSIVLRVLGLVGLLYALILARRQYNFQHFLQQRFISSSHFPANYVKVLNESVAKHEQPPLDFDYASTFTESKIPRTIHFIWFQNLYSTHDGGSQIPAAISRAPELCRQFNPDYEINVWNATGAREFFEKNYSWFIPTYDNYRYPIQRIDALKYFVLYHYGGVYMDLDIACRRPLDPLLDFPAWFPEASPLGVNNDLFAAAKGHPILQRMTLELTRHNKNWLFPYLTIFWSTGPQFSSDILKEWFEHYGPAVLQQGTNGAKSDPAAFFVLPQIYYSEEFTFFGHSPGGTWHGGDVAVILWFVDHPWALLVIIAVAAAAAYKYRQRRRAMAWSKADDRSNAV